MGRGGSALILYLDTSALVKLYVREKGSASVARQLGAADAVSTSMVAWAEARAAFARLLRERPQSRTRHRPMQAIYPSWRSMSS